MVETKILNVSGTWLDVCNAARLTAGKTALPPGHVVTPVFKKAILLAGHSPIRLIHISWQWENMKSWIATHFSRHKWECFITTQRDDRTRIPRGDLSQSVPVLFQGEANVQALIDTARKRLCRRAHSETRTYMLSLKHTLMNQFDTKEIGWSLVPECVYRGGCPEIGKCPYYSRFIEWSHGQADCMEERYDNYNDFLQEELS